MRETQRKKQGEGREGGERGRERKGEKGAGGEGEGERKKRKMFRMVLWSACVPAKFIC